jgi:hypothetical protein
MASSATLSRAPRPSSLADVLDLILDKGLVIDAYVRVSVVGIELLTVDARVVVASVDTYLHFAEAVNRLDIVPQQKGLSSLMGGDDKQDRSNGSRAQAQESRGNGAPASRSSAPRPRRRAELTSGDAQHSEAEPGHRPGFVERIAQRGRVEEESE